MEEDQEVRMNSEHTRKEMAEKGIRYIILQFTDLFGAAKQLTVHLDEWDTLMEGKIMLDGSSIAGFSGVENSDLVLKPDRKTLHIQNWRLGENGIPVAAVYCDVHDLEGMPAQGCSRSMLQRVMAKALDMGYLFQLGIEGEFFLFPTDSKGEPKLRLHDSGAYCDVFPLDRGERIRMEIMDVLRNHGFRIEAGHHEVAPGQHEINFRFGDALEIADRWQSFKQIVRSVAHRNGVFASFIPKPFPGRNGNAMHCNQSLKGLDGSNVFYQHGSETGLSETANRYMAGLLKHAKGMAAIANPTINSYKRLLPGFEAPTHIAWSRSNRTASIRIPGARGPQTRVELRPPDPTANPYLLFAVMLQAGLEGIVQALPLPPEAVGNLYERSEEDKARREIERYPRDLPSALEWMKNDSTVREVMGERSFDYFLKKKHEEAEAFAAEVHAWEIGMYVR